MWLHLRNARDYQMLRVGQCQQLLRRSRGHDGETVTRMRSVQV